MKVTPSQTGHPHFETQPISLPRLLSEVLAITFWVLWLGRSLLDLSPHTWLPGREFGNQVQSHFFWVNLQKCGLCALWNGSINGGWPALGDVFPSTLHPLVGIFTLSFGVIPGEKLTILGSLWIGAMAQWWIGRSLGVGAIARVWTALLAAAGGHLAGDLENGAIAMVHSTAAASLAIAAAVHLGSTQRRRAAVTLGLVGALLILSGQAYIQLVCLLVAPAFIVFAWKRPRLLIEYGLAVALSVLVAGVLLVPALHFFPNTYKPLDASFAASQPLAYVPLNLVIDDEAYYRSGVLGKLPFPYMYNIFIGWIPVLMALLSVRFIRRSDARAATCLALTSFFVFLVASGTPLRWLSSVWPRIEGARHIAVVSGLAVPCILGLAALGLDGLLRLRWPRLYVTGEGGFASQPRWAFATVWVLAIPLLWSLRAPYQMARKHLVTTDQTAVYDAVRPLVTPSTQWVATPFGEQWWVEPALQAGLKVPDTAWAWGWANRELPPPRLLLLRNGEPEGRIPVGATAGATIWENSEVHYASIVTSDGASIPCSADASAGDIQVRCRNQLSGELLVYENSFSGWQLEIDGTPAPIGSGPWLRAQAPAGQHEYRFRYRPWDVRLGLLASIAGLLACGWLWLRGGAAPAARSHAPQRPIESGQLPQGVESRVKSSS